MQAAIKGAMKVSGLAAALLALAAPPSVNGQAPADPTVQVDFSNPDRSPTQWTLSPPARRNRCFPNWFI